MANNGLCLLLFAVIVVVNHMASVSPARPFPEASATGILFSRPTFESPEGTMDSGPTAGGGHGIPPTSNLQGTEKFGPTPGLGREFPSKGSTLGERKVHSSLMGFNFEGQKSSSSRRSYRPPSMDAVGERKDSGPSPGQGHGLTPLGERNEPARGGPTNPSSSSSGSPPVTADALGGIKYSIPGGKVPDAFGERKVSGPSPGAGHGLSPLRENKQFVPPSPGTVPTPFGGLKHSRPSTSHGRGVVAFAGRKFSVPSHPTGHGQ